MRTPLHRRDFIKGVSAAAGTLAFASDAGVKADQNLPAPQTPQDMPVISSVRYQPQAYPIEPKRFSEVALKDAFWQPKMKRSAEVTIPFEFKKFSENQRPVNNNVLQAAIHSLETYSDERLGAQVELAVEALKADRSSKRGPRNDNFEVAVAYYRATQRRDLLDPAVAAADAIYQICSTINPPFSGGERDAINCIALYEVTGNQKYLDLAKHYLDMRGLNSSVDRSRHNQSYRPVLEQSEAVGHAVNCASLMVSLVDVGTLTGIDDYFNAAHRIWTDVVSTKLYVTGGIGSTGNEGFGLQYSLPNLSAYAETCAAIMFTTFNHKMFLATGDSKYIDVMERAMYNNVVDGVGADGDTFFYVNRLASAAGGRNVRWRHASLECCPPNLVRFMASMPGYIYAQRDRELFINLYITSQATFMIDGKKATLSVESGMPWEGRSRLGIHTTDPMKATLKLRIPGWVRGRPVPSGLYEYADKAHGRPSISVNGQTIDVDEDPFGYISLDRTWHKDDFIQVEFPIQTRQIVAHARVRDNRGRMAIERGPIVYCAEWPDFPEGKVLTALFDVNAEWKPAVDKNLLGGATVLDGQVTNISDPDLKPTAARLIPYHLWANRGTGEMAVWLSKEEFAPGDVGPAGGLIFYVNPNYKADGWRYLEAAHFDQSTGAPWGSFRVPLAGASGAAIGTGRQNTLEIKRGCSTPRNSC